MTPRIMGPYKPGIPGLGNGFWVHTPDVDKIREHVRRPLNATLLFYALNKLASDERSKVFAASVYRLVGAAGISERAIKSALIELSEMGLISVEAQDNNCAQKITLLGKVRL